MSYLKVFNLTMKIFHYKTLNTRSRLFIHLSYSWIEVGFYYVRLGLALSLCQQSAFPIFIFFYILLRVFSAELPAFEVLPSLKRLKQRIVAASRGQYDAVFMSGRYKNQ